MGDMADWINDQRLDTEEELRLESKQQMKTDSITLAEESALAMAQATISNVMKRSKTSRTKLAKKLDCSPQQIKRMLSGDYDLTVKELARLLTACGYEYEVEFIYHTRG